MSRNRRSYRQAAYEKETDLRGGRNRSMYVYGNTARELEIQKQMEAEPGHQIHPVVRKNRERAHHMNAGYMFFLAVAMCTAAWILVNYIQLQAELTNLTRSVAAKQSELNSQRLANDEEYNRIVNSIDLEEIKRIAIGELGMTYAQEGQIILYVNEENEYMRQSIGSN